MGVIPDITGAVVSSVNVAAAGTVAVLPALSVATTVSVIVPSVKALKSTSRLVDST